MVGERGGLGPVMTRGIALGWVACGPPASLFLLDPREDPSRAERGIQQLGGPSTQLRTGSLGAPRAAPTMPTVARGGQAWDV